MMNNIAKMALILLMAAAPLSLAYASKQPTNHGVAVNDNNKVMMLAKGQYYNDSRNYKPGTEC